jgi:hypothetical protein
MIRDRRMRKLLLASIVLLLPTLAVAAEQQKPKNSESSNKPRPKGNPCAHYGPGFVQVAGSTTCVKIGSSVTVESGGRR